MSKPLSPAAQAVLDAMYEINLDFGEENAKLAAAALRVVADQVVPDSPRPSADSGYHKDSTLFLMQWSKSLDQYAQRQQTRAEILAIAAKLEGSDA